MISIDRQQQSDREKRVNHLLEVTCLKWLQLPLNNFHK